MAWPVRPRHGPVESRGPAALGAMPRREGAAATSTRSVPRGPQARARGVPRARPPGRDPNRRRGIRPGRLGGESQEARVSAAARRTGSASSSRRRERGAIAPASLDPRERRTPPPGLAGEGSTEARRILSTGTGIAESLGSPRGRRRRRLVRVVQQSHVRDPRRTRRPDPRTPEDRPRTPGRPGSDRPRRVRDTRAIASDRVEVTRRDRPSVRRPPPGRRRRGRPGTPWRRRPPSAARPGGQGIEGGDAHGRRSASSSTTPISAATGSLRRRSAEQVRRPWRGRPGRRGQGRLQGLRARRIER